MQYILSICHEDNFSENRTKLYLPRIDDRNSKMKMLWITSYNDLVLNSMNIPEPSLEDLDGKQQEDRRFYLWIYFDFLLLISVDHMFVY